MTVLDAYAVPAYLRDERCADEVANLLRAPTVLTAANAAEVFDQMVRVYQHDPDDIHADLALLTNAGMQIVPVGRSRNDGSPTYEPGITTGHAAPSASPTASPLQLHSPSNCPFPRLIPHSQQLSAPSTGPYIRSQTATA